MLKVGFLGNVSSGKSSFANVLLGEKVLPSREDATTMAMTHCLVDGGVPEGRDQGKVCIDVAPQEGESMTETRIVGADRVYRHLQAMNDAARAAGRQALERALETGGTVYPKIQDITVRAGACSKLQDIVDGSMRFTDMPGFDENAQPLVEQSKGLIVGLCHCLWVVVSYLDIPKASTAQLLHHIARVGPHLLRMEQELQGRVLKIVVTMADLLDDEEAEQRVKASMYDAIHRSHAFDDFPGVAEGIGVVVVGGAKNPRKLEQQATQRGSWPHEWEEVFRSIHDMHAARDELIKARKVHLSNTIFVPLQQILASPSYSGRYPPLAQEALENEVALQRRRMLQVGAMVGSLAVGGIVAGALWGERCMLLSAAAANIARETAHLSLKDNAMQAATLATIAAERAARHASTAGNIAGVAEISASAIAGCPWGIFGGPLLQVGVKQVVWRVLGGAASQAAAAAAASSAATAAASAEAAAIAAATATAAASQAGTAAAVTAALTSAALAGHVIVLGGCAEVTSAYFGCHGALEALKTIPTLSAEAVQKSKESGEPYMAALFWPEGPDEETSVLYVGEFRGMLPHGRGKLFWKDTQMESFVGDFVQGQIVKGLFVDHEGLLIGQLVNRDGTLEVDGFQLDLTFEPGQCCAVCLDNLPMLAEGLVLAPCMHGGVCKSCWSAIEAQGDPLCPCCRGVVSGTCRY